MIYDFDRVIERKGTNSLKWNVSENELPMWVADMDFQTAPEIIEALQKRTAHGIFGYTDVPTEWYEAYINWWKKRYSYTMKDDWLMFCTGVVPAISSIVRKLTTPAEKVLIQTPVYNIFYNSILNNGRVVLENPLSYDGAEYSIDFEDLETKLADTQTTLMILCNPQNPVGKIWNKEELSQFGELCKKYHVTVISDEIHCDITSPHCKYVPFASVSETCREISVTCIAPTKAFNIAGLQTSAISVPNEALRNRVNRSINTDEVAEPNAFAVDAAIAAFTKSEPWLDELNRYIYDNKCFAADFIASEIPRVKASVSQSTYLMWLDCMGLNISSAELAAEIRKTTGLYVSSGTVYGGNGNGFLRMNIACHRSRLNDGLERLKKGILSL